MLEKRYYIGNLDLNEKPTRSDVDTDTDADDEADDYVRGSTKLAD